MLNEQGGLLEALVSNFYVVKGNQRGHIVRPLQILGGENGYELQTAAVHDGILAGAFRKVILDAVCKVPISVAVNESCPMLSDASSWKEAFVSNR